MISNVLSDIILKSTVCFEEWRTAFKRLSDIIDYTKGFFIRIKVEVRIKIKTKVFKAIEITGILEITRVIIKAVEIKAVNDIKSFYTGYNKVIL